MYNIVIPYVAGPSEKLNRIFNTIFRFTSNMPTHWGRNLSILRKKHPGINRVM